MSIDRLQLRFVPRKGWVRGYRFLCGIQNRRIIIDRKHSWAPPLVLPQAPRLLAHIPGPKTISHQHPPQACRHSQATYDDLFSFSLRLRLHVAAVLACEYIIYIWNISSYRNDASLGFFDFVLRLHYNQGI